MLFWSNARSSANFVAGHVGVIPNSSNIPQNVVDINQVVVPSNPSMTTLIYMIKDLSPTLLRIGMIFYNAFVDPQEFARMNTRSIYCGQKLVGSGSSTTLSVVMIQVLSWMQCIYHFYLRLWATPIAALYHPISQKFWSRQLILLTASQGQWFVWTSLSIQVPRYAYLLIGLTS